MDATSEIESQGRESKMDGEAANIPAELTDQFFDDLQAKCLAVSESRLGIMEQPDFEQDFVILIHIYSIFIRCDSS